MAKIEEKILTPVGRLVRGSLYEPQTEDFEGNPLTIKTGAKAGQPRVHFYLAIAIPKNGETHWANATCPAMNGAINDWGAVIWRIGHLAFPNGQADSPTFAWKIIDGDSQIPDGKQVRPCDRKGHPGHWILNFGGGFPPQICDKMGTRYLNQNDEKDVINLGDYIQIAGTVTDNATTAKPGIYLNYAAISQQGYGEPIILGVDIKKVGFGHSPVPHGASQTKIGGMPAVTPQQTSQYAAPVASQTPPPYYPPMLAQPQQTPQYTAPPAQSVVPPVRVAPRKIMLEKAQGATYEQFIAAGWTDDAMVHEGYMSFEGGV
jgi:hypothetical protein